KNKGGAGVRPPRCTRMMLCGSLRSAEDLANALVHAGDAIVHGLGVGHDGVMLLVEHALDLGSLAGQRHLEVDSGGVQSLDRSLVGGEAFGRSDDGVDVGVGNSREGAGGGDGGSALVRDTPV